MTSQAQINANRLNSQKSTGPTLIAAEWTQRRLRRIEAELWNSREEDLDPTHAEISDTPPNPTSPFPALGHSYPDAIDPFLRIERRIDGTNRMYLPTLVGAGHARPEQAAKPVAPAPEPASPENTQPLNPPNGFVPSFTPAHSGRPAVSNENHESPSKETLEKGRAVADQAPGHGRDA